MMIGNIMSMEIFLMFSEIKDRLIDKYLTWKTGKNKQQRIWGEWLINTINYQASTVEDYYKNFKYVFIS